MFRLGVHISIAKGLIHTLKEAQELNCNTIQIFIRNPRGYRRRKIKPQEAEIFKDKLKEKDIFPFVIHAGYVLNLASQDEELRQRSILIVKEDLSISNDLGADLYVIHFGANRDKNKGINLMCESLSTILNNYRQGTLLVLENTAGEGNKLGDSIDEIRRIIKERFKIGICLDSAHLFSSGYNIKVKQSLDNFLNEFEIKIGFERIKLLHLNDSYYPCGSKKDRHQHIGQGYIGKDGFRLFINHPKLCNLPMILETPKDSFEDDIRNLRIIKQLKTINR